MELTFYTDGSSRGNPGPGGWGTILLSGDLKNGFVEEWGGREDHTTNNRMELSATIKALKEAGTFCASSKEIKHVIVFTDSEYVKKGISEWITGWVARGWKTSAKKPVLNQDLWQDLLKEKEALLTSGFEVAFRYVKAHNGHPLNERADSIATSQADNDPVALYKGSRLEYPFK